MRTRSSLNLVGETSPNPTTSNPKHHNRRRSKQPFILEESSVDTMADQRTMAELLRAPTEGYAEAIVVPPILAEHFELKHSLINMMTSDQFLRLEKDNPRDHNHSLDSAAGGNLLERRTQDVLTIIENKSKQTSAVTTAMTAILKQFQATPPPAFVKAVEEIYVTCSGAHPYYQLSSLMATLSWNFRIIFKDKFQRPRLTTIRNMMASFFQMNTASTLGSRPLPSNTIANPKGELKAITTRSGLVLDVPSIPMPHPFINLEEDECAEETLTDPKLAEYTIKVPPPLNILKAPLSNKEKLLELANTPLNENCSAIILKKIPEKLGDLGKFIISCGFSELKCKALANLGKFTFLADFVIVDYENDPRVPIILGRPFLRTARALIDVHEEEMILHLFETNHLSGNTTFSSHTDLTAPKVINPLNGNTTSSSPNHLLEAFANELALITFPPGNDDLPVDIEFDLKEIEYLLNHDPTKEINSILEDSVDEENLADPNKNLVDTIPEMFTDKHTLNYSSPRLYDDVDDDLAELESDNDYVYADPFDSKVDKIKESKLLIDELDPPDQVISFLPSSMTQFSIRIFPRIA
uniref:Reverse transcriptase domain-containing protein n=1 Tax=Tanacetum cinerariifolium TaxID=118510 RepID=A0A699HI00_TANCI|nr:hypothetical protein [Tanacetum cinerariifolium]